MPAYSGAYNYLPTTGSLVMTAFARCQIRRSEILQEHLQNAADETNLMQVEWANKGPLLWTVDLQTVPLVAGQTTYTVPPETVMILDAFVSIPNGDGSFSDRIIEPLSRTEYASTPDKQQRGAPTSFWFDRLINPTITLWPVPSGFGPTELKYYRFTNIQDAALAGALNPQVPYLWLDAYVGGLAHRMARIYAPKLEQVRETDAAKSYNIASAQGVENVPLYITPTTSSYWR